MSARRGLAILAAVSALGVSALFSAAAHGAEPASEPKPEGERWALIIGINDYAFVAPLRFCREDAQAVEKVLVEQGGFRADRVRLLVDGGRPEDSPTTSAIRASIEQFSKLADPEDTVLVFFSGHGMKADEGKGYLMAADSNRNPINNVSIDWVKQQLAACKAKDKLLILDACHAGSGVKDVGGLAPSMVAGASGVTVLASCADDEVSYPDETAGHGVFAARLIEGLSGKADADNDKGVTVSELYTFVRESMKTWSVHSRKQQTPYLWPQRPPEMVLTRVIGRSPTPGSSSVPPTVSKREQEDRRQRLAELRDRLKLAEKMASDHRFADALAILRNLAKEDRELLATINVSVLRMQAAIEEDAAKWRADGEKRQKLAAQLEQAKQLADEGKLSEALAAYDRIAADFPAELIQEKVDIHQVREDLRARIAAVPKPPPPAMTPAQIAAAVAKLVEEANTLEEGQKFGEALSKLEAIKNYDREFWPEGLEKRIESLEAKKKALEFFNM